MRSRSARRATVLALALLALARPSLAATKPAAASKASDARFKSETFSGLALRNLGPALTSGRITDFALHPSDPHTWYVVAASGGVWKTRNEGTTWTPIFDSQGSYSIGCIAIDPKRPFTVWVGTGEKNSQRSVGYGDGVYKSTDGGKTWKKSGLENSEHVGEILIHPNDPNTVFVAAQGPLWTPGGDRGLYKTKDGGATWRRVLEVDEWTGVSDLAMDPRDPDVLYATSYQRARRVWTLIDGGPGSAIWKSVDGGEHWTKIVSGLPKAQLGRIGIAVSPANPDVVYAIVEAQNREGGTYRSVDGGANWEKRSDYVSSSPQYYQQLVADPKDPDRLYSLDTFLQVSEDGGKTFRRAGEKSKHVDNHVMWIDPANTDHLIVGCDGGLYESFDRAQTWRYTANLPITQFYKICVDDDEPFYNVYGGTQDNNTQGGPSRTRNSSGIVNSDWFVTLGGDGFQPRVDPTDPNVVYSQFQHGELVRFDRRTGERVDIQPQPEPGEDGSRWNWDSPLIVSPHSHTRLYFASQRLYRSDDRGDSWRPVSGDLTRRLDRNRMEMMGRVWSVDAVAKNASTSFYGNCVALSESPKREGLLYVGADDGRVSVSEDGGAHWRAIDRFPGVPDLSYVSRLEASVNDENVVYAAFDNHKSGDFAPYVLRSADRGRTWTSIAGDLPKRGTVYALAEDPENPKLLFAGTEFGVFFTVDGGAHWAQLKGGMPTICVRDLALQAREHDLVVGTFGRGFYVLDDYSPLRVADESFLARPHALLPVRPALWYQPASPLGDGAKAQQGEAFYNADNPPFGATFTYYLREGLTTRKERRQKSEKETFEKGGNVYYPGWDTLRAEAREVAPAIVLTVTDEDGEVVRRVTGPVGEGFHRVTWDLRWPTPTPASLAPATRPDFGDDDSGPLVVPGRYRVQLAQRVDGVETALGDPVGFDVVPLEAPHAGVNAPAVLAFQRKTARLQRAVLGATRLTADARNRVALLLVAIESAPGETGPMRTEARRIDAALRDISEKLDGDPVIRGRNEPTPPSLSERVARVVGGHWFTTQGPTRSHERAIEIASADFANLLPALRALVGDDLVRLERRAEEAGVPWTPGRVPDWRPE